MIKIERFPKGAHILYGEYLPRGWHPYVSIIVPGSFHVKSLTRPHHNNNYLRYFYTLKYAKLVFKHNLTLYAQLHGMSEFKGHVLEAVVKKERSNK